MKCSASSAGPLSEASVAGCCTPWETSLLRQWRAWQHRASDGASPSDNCRYRCAAELFRAIPLAEADPRWNEGLVHGHNVRCHPRCSVRCSVDGRGKSARCGRSV
jgi:hypothetical protein